jgi:hypothetical protein
MKSAPARAVVAPLAAERFKVQVTVSRAVRDKLEEAQHLLKHQQPDGDLAVVLERALDALLKDLRRQKYAATTRPRPAPAATATGAAPAAPAVPARPTSRHIPNAVRRAVAARDGYRCTYVSADGVRCEERAGLEYHHVTPFARGGAHTVADVTIRCRGHNQLAAEQDFGAAHLARVVRARR